MSIIELDLVRWSPRRWWLTILFFLVLQIALLFWISGATPVRPTPPFLPRVKTFDAAFAPEPVREYLEAENPFLFASADRRGFSGSAWLRRPGMRYDAPGPAAAPSHLAFALPSPANMAEAQSMPIPSMLAARPDRVRLQGEVAEPKSTWRLSGPIEERQLFTPVDLPVQRHSDLLGATGVEIAVGPDGLVVASRVVESSGLARADQDALRLARRLRFSGKLENARLPGGLTWGVLHIQWHTLSLEGTNAPAR